MKVWVLLCLLLGSVALAQPPLDQARLYTVQSTIANGQGMASIRLDPQNTLPGTARDYSAPLSGGSLSHPVSLFPGDNRILIEYGNFSKEVTAKLEVKAPEVRVELRWAGRNQDYDLYVKSVNYQNGDAEGGKLDQDWISEDNGDSNPGAENITFAEAEAGLYNISVNYYHDNEDGNNDGQPDGSPQATTVNVFVDGVSVYTATRTISKYDYGASFWGVGTLVIHSGEETGGYMVNPSTGLRDMLLQKAFLDKIAPRGDFEIDEISGPNGTGDVYLLVGQSAQFELTGTVNVGTENEEGGIKIIGDFETSDTNLAEVDKTGIVTGIAPGTVEVRSGSDNSKKVNIHLFSVEMRVRQDNAQGPHGSAPMYIIPKPDDGNAVGELFSLWPTEEAYVTLGGTLTELIQLGNLPANFVKWSTPGIANKANEKEYKVYWASHGLKEVKLEVGDQEFLIRINVPDTGTIDFKNAFFQDGPLRTVIGDGEYNTIRLAGLEIQQRVINRYGQTGSTGGARQDAIRHSSWNAFGAWHVGVGRDKMIIFSTANEYHGRYSASGFSSNTTMDLHNNDHGATKGGLHSGMPTGSAEGWIDTMENEFEQGYLRVWIPQNLNVNSHAHILRNSNGAKVFSP